MQGNRRREPTPCPARKSIGCFKLAADARLPARRQQDPGGLAAGLDAKIEAARGLGSPASAPSSRPTPTNPSSGRAARSKSACPARHPCRPSRSGSNARIVAPGRRLPDSWREVLPPRAPEPAEANSGAGASDMAAAGWTRPRSARATSPYRRRSIAFCPLTTYRFFRSSGMCNLQNESTWSD
jgi:hypothetical protein